MVDVEDDLTIAINFKLILLEDIIGWFGIETNLYNNEKKPSLIMETLLMNYKLLRTKLCIYSPCYHGWRPMYLARCWEPGKWIRWEECDRNERSFFYQYKHWEKSNDDQIPQRNIGIFCSDNYKHARFSDKHCKTQVKLNLLIFINNQLQTIWDPLYRWWVVNSSRCILWRVGYSWMRIIWRESGDGLWRWSWLC